MPLVDVRRLAAVDMHGVRGTLVRRRIILAEFVLGAVLGPAIGVLVAASTSSLGWRLFGAWVAASGSTTFRSRCMPSRSHVGAASLRSLPASTSHTTCAATRSGSSGSSCHSSSPCSPSRGAPGTGRRKLDARRSRSPPRRIAANAPSGRPMSFGRRARLNDISRHKGGGSRCRRSCPSSTSRRSAGSV